MQDDELKEILRLHRETMDELLKQNKMQTIWNLILTMFLAVALYYAVWL